MTHTFKLLASVLATSCTISSYAAIAAEDAKALGTTLTSVGAEKAGNKDGTIPEYTGGLTTPPAAFKAGLGIRPNLSWPTGVAYSPQARLTVTLLLKLLTSDVGGACVLAAAPTGTYGLELAALLGTEGFVVLTEIGSGPSVLTGKIPFVSK